MLSDKTTPKLKSAQCMTGWLDAMTLGFHSIMQVAVSCKKRILTYTTREVWYALIWSQ